MDAFNVFKNDRILFVILQTIHMESFVALFLAVSTLATQSSHRSIARLSLQWARVPTAEESPYSWQATTRRLWTRCDFLYRPSPQPCSPIADLHPAVRAKWWVFSHWKVLIKETRSSLRWSFYRLRRDSCRRKVDNRRESQISIRQGTTNPHHDCARYS